MHGKSKKTDPRYELKGGARVAREYYRPPGYKEDDEPENLLDIYAGRMYEHIEGQKLMKALIDLGMGLHNKCSRTKEAIAVFKEMLQLDRTDNLLARHYLLRCYFDNADGVKSRELLERFPDDEFACFAYGRALLEHISFAILEETDSSSELRNEMLSKAYSSNPYVLWMLVYNDIFSDVINEAGEDMVEIISPTAGSIEDAYRYFFADLGIWQDTEGAIKWLKEYMFEQQLPPPLVEVADGTDNSSSVQLSSSSTSEVPISQYYDLFVSGLELIPEDDDDDES